MSCRWSSRSTTNCGRSRRSSTAFGRLQPRPGTELIFVDDGSTDAGRSLLDPLPRDDVRVIVHPTNRGKGAAVKTGLEAATGDILCIQDADLEYDPATCRP